MRQIKTITLFDTSAVGKKFVLLDREPGSLGLLACREGWHLCLAISASDLRHNEREKPYKSVSVDLPKNRNGWRNREDSKRRQKNT